MYILFNDTVEPNQCPQNENSGLSLHIYVKCPLLIYEFYEITREAQCHALPLDPSSTSVFQ